MSNTTDNSNIIKTPATPIAGGRDALAHDRILAGCVIFVIFIATFAFTPSAPWPLDLQRHAAAAAGSACLLVLGAIAALGRGVPVPPMPVATITLGGICALSAALCQWLEIGHSPARACAAAACAAGLVLIAAVARSCARAHLGSLLLNSIFAIGFVVSCAGLLEAWGVDPFGSAGFYNSKMSPVATFGNPDAAVDFIIPVACAAAALACARGGASRIILLMIAAVGAAWAGRLGVLFGIGAAGAGLAAALLLTIARVRAGGAGAARALGPSIINITVPAAAFLIFFVTRPAEVEMPVPASSPASSSASLQIEKSSVPPSLEVRLRIWAGSVRVMRSFAPFGTAIGHFAIGFAPFRDPRELDITTHHRRDSAESVVDVAHNDAIQLITETGVLGILAIIAIASGILHFWRSRFFSATPNTVAASAGLAALFICCMFHSPFYENAAAACTGFVFLGIVGAADGGVPERLHGITGRMIGIVMILCAPWALVVTGSALTADVNMIIERLDPQPGAARLERALLYNPLDEHIPLTLARRLDNEGNIQGALIAWMEADRRRPFLFESKFQTGVLLAKLGAFDKAMLAFNSCVMLDREHPKLAYNRALVARDLGEDLAAAKLLKEAIQLGIDPETLKIWGMAFFEKKELNKARIYLNLWVAEKPGDADVWSMLGQASLQLKDRASAGVELANAHRIYALEFLRAGNFDAAARSTRQYYNWAAANDAGPALLDAAIALASGHRENAKKSLDRIHPEPGTAPPVSTLDPATPELQPLLNDVELGGRIRAHPIPGFLAK